MPLSSEISHFSRKRGGTSSCLRSIMGGGFRFARKTDELSHGVSPRPEVKVATLLP